MVLSGCTTNLHYQQEIPFDLHGLFGDHMVLQRDKPIKIFGNATAGSNITVSFNQQKQTVITQNNNHWEVVFPKLSAGGPYRISASNNGKNISYNDILIGDVWLASGQSNMAFTLAKTKDDLSSIDNSQIRIFDVSNTIKLKAQTELEQGTNTHQKWLLAKASTIKSFSAVGYYFADEIFENTGIPIGVIGSSWGGTEVEAWTSSDALANFPIYADEVRFLNSNTKQFVRLDKQFNQWRTGIIENGIGLKAKWYLPETNVSQWDSIEIPNLYEKKDDILSQWNGAIWFRTTFDLPVNMLDKQMKIRFGQIDDHDKVWLNGKFLGETFGKKRHTKYNVKKHILKGKNNVLMVRVFDMSHEGGFKSPPQALAIFPINEPKNLIKLAGHWQYKRGSGQLNNYSFSAVPFFDIEGAKPNSLVSSLYNSMIHPLTNFPIKGAIWYQGEANASRAYEYYQLFPNLISNWRNKWHQNDMPFYFVQLANFQKRSHIANNPDHFWPELRDAQKNTLLLPNTGMAVTIDIGEAKDIHPKNKRDVGKRLAANALKFTYGKDVVPSGPLYHSHELDNSNMVISFDSIGDGLLSKSGKHLKGFAIAGKDRHFYWAKAKIKNSKVVVWSDEVTYPVAVRYAWANNPEVSLYNKEGLPASPFRTDNWKLITQP